MTRRKLVKAAIQHRETDRIPYSIDLCGEAWEALRPIVGTESAGEFVDNDVEGVGIPWWDWYNPGEDRGGVSTRQTHSSLWHAR